MIKKSNIYWYCQILGWSFYIILNSIYFGLSARPDIKDFLVYFLMLPSGITISHVYRLFLKKIDLLSYKVPIQLLGVVLFSVINGIVFFVVVILLSKAFDLALLDLNLILILESVSNFSVIFFLWNVIYFGFHYFQNYKRSEINALRYLAASREFELSNLKAQLNPHFIFNCMNSIRALVDENPSKAKEAVTRLSNILRNTLLIDKSKEITLEEELNLVKDYLNLEQIRYEERLRFDFDIADNTRTLFIPPFMIQSQVENAIKHGISKLPGKGVIQVKTTRSDKQLLITVANTGTLSNQQPLTGIGFKNSLQRLTLLYGDLADIGIRENNNLVTVTIQIPITTTHS